MRVKITTIMYIYHVMYYYYLLSQLQNLNGGIMCILACVRLPSCPDKLVWSISFLVNSLKLKLFDANGKYDVMLRI